MLGKLHALERRTYTSTHTGKFLNNQNPTQIYKNQFRMQEVGNAFDLLTDCKTSFTFQFFLHTRNLKFLLVHGL